jgi:hypothetical protein
MRRLLQERVSSPCLVSRKKFNLLLENYMEFEQELLNLTARQMVFTQSNWSSFNRDIQVINRRMANLLTACRLYVDQVSHDISLLYGSCSDHLQKLKKEFSKQYDSKVEGKAQNRALCTRSGTSRRQVHESRRNQ